MAGHQVLSLMCECKLECKCALWTWGLLAGSHNYICWCVVCSHADSFARSCQAATSSWPGSRCQSASEDYASSPTRWQKDSKEETLCPQVAISLRIHAYRTVTWHGCMMQSQLGAYCTSLNLRSVLFWLAISWCELILVILTAPRPCTAQIPTCVHHLVAYMVWLQRTEV